MTNLPGSRLSVRLLAFSATLAVFLLQCSASAAATVSRAPRMKITPQATQGVAAHGGHQLGYSLTPSTSEPYATCKPQPPGIATCLSISPPKGAPLSYEGGGEEGSGLTPTELREAYGIPKTGGAGQTIAIVDAFDDAQANADLEKYRSAYGLGACTEGNKCFERVNQEGKPEDYPEPASVEWKTEISLDLDMASAICPECHIRLVEANSAEGLELLAAVDVAAGLVGTAGATTEITNSWTIDYNGEESEETGYD